MAIADDYARTRGSSLQGFLGNGTDGAVWASDSQTAIKVIERQDSYFREKNAYLRLQQHDIIELQGFAVPSLVGTDDTRRVVEMTIVFPPCILDFAKAYVDTPPDYSPEIIRDWYQNTADLFESNMPKVEALLDDLNRVGIFYFDAKPGNIIFTNE